MNSPTWPSRGRSLTTPRTRSSGACWERSSDVMTPFRRVIFEDFEYATAPGERPTPVCSTALEWPGERLYRSWLWDEKGVQPPFSLGPDDLYVAYHVPAELRCRLVPDWPLPRNVVDLCVE